MRHVSFGLRSVLLALIALVAALGPWSPGTAADKPAKNADGTVDLYFGPTAPSGKPKSNWIQTLPGKGWFSYFRLYGPTQAYFDRSWVLPDLEKIQ